MNAKTAARLAARGIAQPGRRGAHGPQAQNGPRAATHADRRTRRQRDRGAAQRAALRDQH